MTSIFNVAAYVVITMGGTIDCLRLQRLCYYSQAWALAWTGSPLFSEVFQAWDIGPISPDLFERLCRMHFVHSADLPEANLAAREKQIVDAVLAFYGTLTTAELGDQTRSEEPWLLARKVVPSGLGGVAITGMSMRRYYLRLAKLAAA